MYQMASTTLFMLRVIVRVVGPAPDNYVHGGPDRGGTLPWIIA